MRDPRAPQRRPTARAPARPTPRATSAPAAAESGDGALIQRLATGDARALGVAYDEYAPLVYGVLLRMLQNAAAAEELLQEVFWTLWTRPERFDPTRGNLRVFLFQLARSRALDHLRRERRRSGLLRERPVLAPDPSDAGAQSNPLLAAVSAEDRTRVRRALAALPAAQQRVLTLSYFEGLSHSEIAEQLGEPLGTVKTRIRGGLARMRARLGHDEAGTERSWNEM